MERRWGGHRPQASRVATLGEHLPSSRSPDLDPAERPGHVPVPHSKMNWRRAVTPRH